jgi:hypothetical protein
MICFMNDKGGGNGQDKDQSDAEQQSADAFTSCHTPFPPLPIYPIYGYGFPRRLHTYLKTALNYRKEVTACQPALYRIRRYAPEGTEGRKDQQA